MVKVLQEKMMRTITAMRSKYKSIFSSCKLILNIGKFMQIPLNTIRKIVQKMMSTA